MIANAKALGVDYGDRRTGIAVSDALGMVARPLVALTRSRHDDLAAGVAALAAEHQVGTVVLGLPLHMDGSAGAAVAKIHAFAARLAPLLPPGTIIAYTDERLSTVQAQELLRHRGAKPTKEKGALDRTAATIILQDWLDARQGPDSILLPEPLAD